VPTSVAVAPGASQTFTVAAAPGFSIAGVLLDGTSSMASPYAVTNVGADHTIAATFLSPIRILETGIFFGSLQAAYDAANTGWTIQTQVTIPSGDLLVNRDLAITDSGGYDSSFTNQSGTTAIRGNVTITNGTLTTNGLIIQGP
jgi:hypothetical protein